MLRKAIITVALFCATVAAQSKPKAIKLEASGDLVMVVRSFSKPCIVTAPGGADIYVWQWPDAVKADPAEFILTITSAPKGEHRISVTSLTFVYDEASKKWTKTKDVGSIVLVVGDLPKPPGPTPPDPPTPAPPTPDGPFRVLIVYESEDLPKMALKQQEILFGRKLRDWLNAKCAADGDRKAWRIWDKDTDATADASHWQAAIKRPRSAVPFLHVFRGDKAVHEGALPDDQDATLMLLERIEGGK